MIKFFSIIFLFIINIHAQKLSMEIELDRFIFLEGEPIIVIIKLSNPGQAPADISGSYPSFSTWYEIIINDSQGTRLNLFKEYNWGDGGVKVPIFLQSGSNTYRYLHISDWYGNSHSGNLLPMNQHFLPGKYKVQVKLSPETYSVTSNEIEFEVVQPQTEILVSIKNKIHTAVVHFVSDKDAQAGLKIFKNILFEITKDFPENEYTYLAFANLTWAYKQDIYAKRLDQESFNLFYEQLVEKHSNRLLTFLQAHSLFTYYDSPRKSAILEKLKTSKFNYTRERE